MGVAFISSADRNFWTGTLILVCQVESVVKRGGVLLKGDAGSLRASGGGWSVATEGGTLQAKDVVIALGPWSDQLARSLGYRFPFGVKRGYHMHYAPRGNQGLSRPVLDFEKG